MLRTPIRVNENSRIMMLSGNLKSDSLAGSMSLPANSTAVTGKQDLKMEMTSRIEMYLQTIA